MSKEKELFYIDLDGARWIKRSNLESNLISEQMRYIFNHMTVDNSQKPFRNASGGAEKRISSATSNNEMQ